jgi:hypothetical protein
MPDGGFPQLSDTTKTAAQLTGWASNAEERALSAQGAQQSRKGQQWLRRISLVVYGGEDKPLELGLFRVDFQVKKMTNSSPNFFYAKVYNLSPKTQQKIRQYGRVQLSAGYKTANYGMIFDGTVVMCVEAKENPTDSYLEIFAGDGDKGLNSGVIAQTWPAGTLPSQKIQDAIKASGFIEVGEVKLSGEQKSVRSSTYVGGIKDAIRNETNAHQADFFVDNGVGYVIPWSGYRKGEVVNLSPTTGLVGIPKVTPNGIEAQCLLNPKLRLGGLVHIDLKYLSGLAFQPGSKPETPGGQTKTYQGMPTPFTATGPKGYTFGAATTNPVGTYKILLLDHLGDTRGNPWYSSIVCAAAGENGELLSNTFAGTALLRSVGERPAGG